jgi:hypothetical protein
MKNNIEIGDVYFCKSKMTKPLIATVVERLSDNSVILESSNKTLCYATQYIINKPNNFVFLGNNCDKTLKINNEITQMIINYN